MPYTVEVYRAAREVLAALPEKIRHPLGRMIAALGENPRPVGSRALHGRHAGLRRIRSGDFRIIYRVEDQHLLVLVVKIGHRREVYR